MVRRLRRLPRAALLVLVALGLPLAACASLLDLKELPLVPSDASRDTAPLADASDGACAPRGPNFCEQLCPPADFCDDFEGSRLGAKWVPIFGVQNPIISGDGKMSLATDTTGSGTQSLLAEVTSSSDQSASAVLLTGLDKAVTGRKPRGLRVVLDAHPPVVAWTQDGGTTRKTLSFLAVGSQAANRGVGVLLVDDDASGDLRIVLQQRALGGGGGQIDLLSAVTAKATDFTRNWLTLEVIVGTPALLQELAIPCALPDAGADDAGVDAGPDDMKFVIRLGALGTRCAALREELVSRSWLTSAALIAGAAISDFGTARVFIDNVAVTFLD